MRKIISTTNAPAAVGPYSQANLIDNTLYCSGQIPLDPTTGEIVGSDVETQIHQVFANIKAVLEAAGTTLDNVIKTTCFLQDINDFAKMNEIYATYFSEGAYPSRSLFEVAKLPKNALVEIEVIAVIKE